MCTGARINGRMVPLRTQIQNGDVVEIITATNSHPSRDWLNFIVTSRARNRVRHWVATTNESIDRTKAVREGSFAFSAFAKSISDTDGHEARRDGLWIRSRRRSAGRDRLRLVPRNIIAKYL